MSSSSANRRKRFTPAKIKALDRLLRVAAVLSSLALMVGFVWYRSATAEYRENLRRVNVMPSSKIGTATEIHSTDWSGKYPAASLGKPNFLKTVDEYEIEPGDAATWTPQSSASPSHLESLPGGAFMGSSKSGRIIDITVKQAPTPTPTGSPTP